MTCISVLLPTRQRINLVKQSLHSLLSRSQDPTNIEILIAYDEDDVESATFFASSEWTQWVKDHNTQAQTFAVTRWGYKQLHEYYNFLSRHSQGSWLLIWNDDASMETTGWDDVVRQNDDWRMLLHMTCSNLVMRCSIFPLFHRDWIELFGTVSPINHPDSWISEVCWQARARRVIPVSAYHDRADLTGNNKDNTFLARDYSTQVEFNSDAMKSLRREWATKLQDYLKNKTLI